jgi:DNA-binding transcriptional LysR family regulator
MAQLIPRISLEQWRILQAVVDRGGFAQAAEALNRSQSSISYAIKSLQEQLPSPVLVQRGRRAELTEAGKALLRRARGLIAEALSIERLAANLAQGWESEIRLAVEIIFPPDLALSALQRFAEGCSSHGRDIRVQLIESVLSGTEEALLTRSVDLAVSGRIPPGFLGRPLMPVEFVPVAHREHSLHTLGRALGEQDLKAQRQLVVRDSGLRRKQDAGWLGAEQRWTVSHLKTSIQALKRGLGFAWVPREHIREELAGGELRVLPLEQGGSRYAQLYLVFADSDSAGPGTRELARVLQETSEAACELHRRSREQP